MWCLVPSRKWKCPLPDYCSQEVTDVHLFNKSFVVVVCSTRYHNILIMADFLLCNSHFIQTLVIRLPSLAFIPIILNTCDIGIWWGQTFLLGYTWDTMDNSLYILQFLSTVVWKYSSSSLTDTLSMLQMLKFLMDYSPSSPTPPYLIWWCSFYFCPWKHKKVPCEFFTFVSGRVIFS